MSTISSETLFHFTNSAEYLISIFRSEFYPRYSLETLLDLGNGNKLEVAIPMVCFCDIPLSQIKNHLNTYGYYGIGMSKDWAKKVGLNPVLYLRSGSDIAKHLEIILKNLIKAPKINEPVNKAKKAVYDMLRYIKP